MKSVRVIAARYDEEYDHIEVVKEIINDDDTVELNLHTFDREALEWRASVYDIDDVDALIDVIIYEPYMEEFNPLNMNKEQATRQCKENIISTKTRLRPVTPAPKPNGNGNGNGNGKFSSAALTQSLMLEKGVEQKYLAALNDDPYEVIKQHSLIQPAALRVKRIYIEEQRQKNKNEKKRSRIVDEETRAKHLENRLIARRREPVEQSIPVSKITELPTIEMRGRKRQ